jgi:pimeloyl-ACP methyl ester carboxylesterase
MERMRMLSVGDASLAVVEMSTAEPGEGDPILVIQTALAAEELLPLSRRLARADGFRVIHQHRRGYAGSGPLTVPRSVAGEAADTAALISTLGVAPAYVVGVSFSAAIALTLAASAPGLVRGVAVVEPPPVSTPGAAELARSSDQLLHTYATRGLEAALDGFMTILVGPEWRDASEQELGGSAAAIERDAATFFESDIPALLAWRLEDDEMTRIEAPVLWVGGDQSPPWFGQMEQRLGSLLPHLESVTVEGAGHNLASTHPDEVTAALLASFGG